MQQEWYRPATAKDAEGLYRSKTNLARHEARLVARTCAACLILFDTIEEKHKHCREHHNPHMVIPPYQGKLLNPMSERI
jgi:hypothetical protein